MSDSVSSSGARSRRRILDAAVALASQGGYDALQVRAIAERAGVSSRTIYANFASLDSLLIVAVAELSEVLYRKYSESPPAGHTAASRVNQVVREVTETMTSNRALSSAVLRALLSGKPDVTPHVRDFRGALRAILESAITTGTTTATATTTTATTDREIAEVLESIWFTALAGFASGVEAEPHIGEIMQRSTRLLLPVQAPPRKSRFHPDGLRV
jgi:TetR/AcrR family transcriptional regulator, cholesterol catabolism regulator